MNSILEHRGGGGILAVDSILLCLMATFLLTHVVSWVYLRTHRGVSYSGTMARSLIILSLIVALVMLVIGNNIARAFGLFGALALIRFRTPVKDANDTVFLFFAVAIGIATGTSNILVGGIGTLTICAIILYLTATGFGNPLDHDGLLRFHLPVSGGPDKDIQTILGRYCDRFNLLHIREVEGGSAVEMSYQVKLVDLQESSQLATEIKAFNDVSKLSLLMQDNEAAP
jgi:Domain of unknown function (DUF4956)